MPLFIEYDFRLSIVRVTITTAEATSIYLARVAWIPASCCENGVRAVHELSKRNPILWCGEVLAVFAMHLEIATRLLVGI